MNCRSTVRRVALVAIGAILVPNGKPVHTSEAAAFSTRFRAWHGDSVLTDTDGRPGEQHGFVALQTAERDTYRMRFGRQQRVCGAAVHPVQHGLDTRIRRHAPAQPELLPLLTLRYDLDVDLRNVLTHVDDSATHEQRCRQCDTSQPRR